MRGGRGKGYVTGEGREGVGVMGKERELQRHSAKQINMTHTCTRNL